MTTHHPMINPKMTRTLSTTKIAPLLELMSATETVLHFYQSPPTAVDAMNKMRG
jgi:hypothetical protein